MSTSDLRIPVPSFAATLTTILEVVAESPEAYSKVPYLDDLGIPQTIVSTALNHLDAPLSAFRGNRPHYIYKARREGVPGIAYNVVRFPLLWERLFSDHDDCIFRELREDRDCAERYLVYALLDHLAQGEVWAKQRFLPWNRGAIRGLRTFRKFLLSPSSGFLVQSRGAHGDLCYNVDTMTADAITSLKK